MNDKIRELRGSKRRDDFNYFHKIKLGNGYNASDTDLALLEFKKEKPIVAKIDVKAPNEDFTETEKLYYDYECRGCLYLIVRFNDAENGPFDVYQYQSGGTELFIRHCKDWNDWKSYEDILRDR